MSTPATFSPFKDALPTDSPHWWQGASLKERADALKQYANDTGTGAKQRALPVAADEQEEASLRLKRWQAETGLAEPSRLAERLQPLCLDAEALRQLLADSDHALSLRMPQVKPAWQNTLESIYLQPSVSNEHALNQIVLPVAESNRTAIDFLQWLKPLIGHACRTLHQQLIDQSHGKINSALALIELARPALCLQLYRIIQRCLLLEMQVRRLQNHLQGKSPEQRYNFFIQQLQDPQQALAIFADYPVLARQVLIRTEQWCMAYSEFFHRFTNDQQRLSSMFNQGRPLGSISAIDAGQGDRHDNGRSVFVVHFSSGLRVVYKPKPLAVDVAFQQFLEWINQSGFTPQFSLLPILDCGEYGWTAFISHAPCSNQQQVERFYQRQGGYLALLFLLEATDFHYENIIAHGENPYLIDLETLLQPHLSDPTAVGPGARITVPTVMRNGMLPTFQISRPNSPMVDLSGLGNSHGRPTAAAELRDEGMDTLHLAPMDSTMPAGANQALLDDQPTLVQDYAPHVLDGFTRLYRLLLARRDDLLAGDGPLRYFENCRIRYLIRGTGLYVRLLHAAFHPDYLQNGLMRDRLFDKLWLDYDFYPAVRPLIPSEQQALARADVPLFYTHTGSKDLHDDNGQTFENFFPHSGLDQCRLRAQQLNHDDLQLQYRLVRDCLQGLKRHGWDKRLRPRQPTHPVTRRDLQDTALLLGHRIEQQAIHHNGFVGWLQPHLQSGSGWSLSASPVNLYDGLAGLALFFVTLGQASGEARFHRLSEQIWHSVRRRIMENPKALQNLGAYSGWGGVFYTASRLQRLGITAGTHDEISLWYQRLQRDLPHDREFDLIAGNAGAIMGLLHWYNHGNDERALTQAVACGEHLLHHAREENGGLAWPCAAADGTALTGWGHGAAGIAKALFQLGHHSGDKRFTQAAQAALTFENHWYSAAHQNWRDRRARGMTEDQCYLLAWCHGAPGIGLGRLALLEENTLDPTLHTMIKTDLERAVGATVNTDFGYNQSLCHGDLGNLELIHRAGITLQHPEWLQFCQQQWEWLLPLLRENRQRSGLQIDAEAYGMMNGLAGMAYALLRFADPDNVPSILTLD